MPGNKSITISGFYRRFRYILVIPLTIIDGFNVILFYKIAECNKSSIVFVVRFVIRIIFRKPESTFNFCKSVYIGSENNRIFVVNFYFVVSAEIFVISHCQVVTEQ